MAGLGMNYDAAVGDEFVQAVFNTSSGGAGHNDSPE
jgi:hypothetical protein